jgi:molybdopterin-guanine dinucleotide biosynthesis protein A
MDGADKGLALLNGRPLVAWVLERIAPQVDELFISANRNLDQYRLFEHPVLPDTSPDFQGPLAGLLRAMAEAVHPLILSVPCDTPFLPDDLVGRLTEALEESSADIAITVQFACAGAAFCPAWKIFSFRVVGGSENGNPCLTASKCHSTTSKILSTSTPLMS